MDAPDCFYKYRSLSGTSAAYVERTICHNEIYLPAPSAFNDPFDCQPVFDMSCTEAEAAALFNRVLARKAPETHEEERARFAQRIATTPIIDPQSPEAHLHMQRMHEEIIRNNIGVYCLSVKRDDLLMWAHYADSHRGVCLEFDSSISYFAVAQDVEYSEERDPINPFRDTPDVAMPKALLRKSSHWKYEQEWRVVEYDHGPGVYKVPPEALTGVILGAAISTSDAEAILRWANERHIPLPIYRAYACKEHFRLQIESLS